MSAENFEIMRFQVMAFALSNVGKLKISDAYLYAWDNGVYPIDHEAAHFHLPFAADFKISKEMLDGLVDYLGACWDRKVVPTFYELETHYNVRSGNGPWERWSLIRACRYLYLCESFDKEFWQTLLTEFEHPTEAASLARAFNRDAETYFN